MPERGVEVLSRALIGCDVRAALAIAVVLLSDAGIEGASVDARRLLVHVLGARPLDLISAPDRTLTTSEAKSYANALLRRQSCEPVSRIIGVRGFFGRDFIITPATLDPRPETETLIETALAWVDANGGREREINILDIGTGSGVILVTLLAELPNANGVGIDLSAQALAVAQMNATLHGVDGHARWIEGRTFGEETGPFDLVVSNPPYIPSADIARLDADVRLYDPPLALDGGGDGLLIYREIATGIAATMPSGAVIVEVGAGQASDVAYLLQSAWSKGGCSEARLVRDLGGIERCVAIATLF